MSKNDYRRYAGECLALAQSATNAKNKARLLQMAQAWLDMAAKSEPPDQRKKGITKYNPILRTAATISPA